MRVIIRETKRKADLVVTVRSFLRLSAPGFSLWTSPFFGTGFFCFLWRAALMVSAQCLGCNYRVIKWKEMDAEKEREMGKNRKRESERIQSCRYWVNAQRQTWEFCIHNGNTSIFFFKGLEKQHCINYLQHFRSVISFYSNSQVLSSASS